MLYLGNRLNEVKSTVRSIIYKHILLLLINIVIQDSLIWSFKYFNVIIVLFRTLLL